MDCTEFLQRYSDYDDSLVPPSDLGRFRAHLEVCASCARYDRVLRKGRMLARQGAGVEPSDDFVPRLRSRIVRESHRAERSSEASSRLAAALAAVTVVLVLSTALGLLAGAPEASAPAPAVAASAPAAAPVLPAPDGPVAPAAFAAPWGWGEERVDRPRSASYSPLVTGPPVYRAATR